MPRFTPALRLPEIIKHLSDGQLDIRHSKYYPNFRSVYVENFALSMLWRKFEKWFIRERLAQHQLFPMMATTYIGSGRALEEIL